MLTIAHILIFAESNKESINEIRRIRHVKGFISVMKNTIIRSSYEFFFKLVKSQSVNLTAFVFLRK